MNCQHVDLNPGAEQLYIHGVKRVNVCTQSIFRCFPKSVYISVWGGAVQAVVIVVVVLAVVVVEVYFQLACEFARKAYARLLDYSLLTDPPGAIKPQIIVPSISAPKIYTQNQFDFDERCMGVIMFAQV